MVPKTSLQRRRMIALDSYQPERLPQCAPPLFMMAILALVGFAGVVRTEQPNQVAEFMKLKLKHSRFFRRSTDS